MGSKAMYLSIVPGNSVRETCSLKNTHEWQCAKQKGTEKNKANDEGLPKVPGLNISKRERRSQSFLIGATGGYKKKLI
jgi:hypothetical protein